MIQAVQIYKQEIDSLRKENINLSEKSYRTALENFLKNSISQNKIPINIFQEIPERHQNKLIIPDFACISNIELTTIGYIETKDFGFDIDSYIESEQIKKYRQICDNILLTNYTKFIWISQEHKQSAGLEEESKLDELIGHFFKTEPPKTRNPKKLAHQLAFYSRNLKDVLLEELNKESTRLNPSVLYGIYQIFQKALVRLSFSEFADAFAQMTAFGFMIVKLNKSNQTITLENVRKLLPKQFELIKELLKFLDDVLDTDNQRMSAYVRQLLGLMNRMEVESIEKELFTRKKETINLFGEPHTHYIDPFIYFYEDFLASYDKELRKAKGVYYTPMPVVQFIVKLIDKTLQEDFKLEKGIANQNVTGLDFACGTGTFILEYAAQALAKYDNELKNKYALKIKLY